MVFVFYDYMKYIAPQKTTDPFSNVTEAADNNSQLSAKAFTISLDMKDNGFVESIKCPISAGLTTLSEQLNPSQ